MKLAIISDIHSNLEALEAAFKDIQSEQIDTIYCTGDLVGYAANPNEVIDLLRQNSVKCTMGNHDYACFNQQEQDEMHKNANKAIEYTKRVLTPGNLLALKSLPLYIKENEIYLTHGLPPQLFGEYIYFQGEYELTRAFSSFREQVAFVGHTHLFEVYELTKKRNIHKYEFPELKLTLYPLSRYMVSNGSIGQPRDPNREAGYLVYDSENKTIEKHLIDYPVNITIQKIKDAGLPKENGLRLLKQ